MHDPHTPTERIGGIAALEAGFLFQTAEVVITGAVIMGMAAAAAVAVAAAMGVEEAVVVLNRVPGYQPMLYHRT